MDSKTKAAIFQEAIASGNHDGTQTQAYRDYMTAQAFIHSDFLEECGVNYEKEPELAGWMLWHLEKDS